MIFGSVDQCVEHVRFIRDTLGVDYLGVTFWFAGLAPAHATRAMERFTREVIPRVEAAAARAAAPAH
jgi:hypothetical protein